ncbi:hypothetical protein ATI61_106112 [Archangium gephyra]|uniref:Lipoprotein n=1 Tax=Archangium gephyra TaxID=48 RepID=A0AAC8Q0W4_9BACT|nr:hypothetical protein [Archangium gephyra]AKI98716.1 putative lipoprotein [Archangium gephyra]REG30643.1 hypothetical protein ATI61_106112 [Archangium gephyra]
MRLRTTLLLGLLTGCATPASSSKTEAPAAAPAESTPAPAEPAPASGKLELQALSARELAPLPKQKVSAPEGAFTGEVEAAGAPTLQKGEGLFVLSVPLGTGSPLTCFVYAQPVDAGGAIYRLVEMVGQRTQLQRVRTTDIRLIGESPAVYAEAQYLVDMPRGKAAGLAKMMVYVHDPVSLVCTHDEPGYSESFARVTRGLAASLQGPGGTPPASRYFEFNVIRVQGHPVGFEKRVMRDAAGGGRLTEVESSLFFPRSPQQLLVQDTVSSELSDKDGKLVARDYARASNGTPDIQMALKQVRGREYHYEGTHLGKELNGGFTAPADLATEPGTARLVRERFLPGPDPELTLHFYMPSANPVAPVQQVLRKGAAGSRELTVELGSLKATLTLDSQGMTEKVVTPLGGTEMVQERVSARGTP